MRSDLVGVERRRRWTCEQKLAVLSEVGVDGASVSDIARRHDVPRQNLYQWRRDVRRKTLIENLGVTFIPVTPPEPLRSYDANTGAGVEIVLRNGRCLRGVAGLAEADLVQLIRAVERA